MFIHDNLLQRSDPVALRTCVAYAARGHLV